MKYKNIKLLVFVPAFLEPTGDAVNERELVKATASYVEKIYCITLPCIKNLLNRRKLLRSETLPRNIQLIFLPLPRFSLVLKALISLFYSFLVALITILLERLRIINAIYVRNTWLGIGFTFFSPIIKSPSILKLPGLLVNEVRALNSRFLQIIRTLLKGIERNVLLHFKFLAIPSPLWKDVLKYLYKVSENKLVLCPAGVNLKELKNILTDAPKPRISSDNIVIGFIGLLTWWQGVDILVKAISLLKARGVGVRLLIIGDGPQRPFIEKMLRTLHIDYKITGFIPHKKALECLSVVDALVLPRKRTLETESNIPIKVMEAWALGIPVIVTKHKVFLRLNFKEGEDLLYCEPTPYDVAQAILRLLRDKNLRYRLSVNGPKLAEIFSYDTIAERILDVL